MHFDSSAKACPICAPMQSELIHCCTSTVPSLAHVKRAELKLSATHEPEKDVEVKLASPAHVIEASHREALTNRTLKADADEQQLHNESASSATKEGRMLGAA